MKIENNIFLTLEELGLVSIDSVELVQSFVRDSNNISVYKCNKSGLFFLSSSNHLKKDHYRKKQPTHIFGTKKREMIKSSKDSQRRFSDFSDVIRNRRWLDIGCGSGAMLDLFGPISQKCIGIEPQENARNSLTKLGYDVKSSIDEINEQMDVITMFHVFEHIEDPLQMLKKIKLQMKSGGKLVIEIPHASDFLLKFISHDSFKAHTFWSEHLVLYTRQTIQSLLEYAGFYVEAISGVQRYSLANTLYWLTNNKPNGHIEWDFLCNSELDCSWEKTLSKLDLTDTLVIESRIK